MPAMKRRDKGEGEMWEGEAKETSETFSIGIYHPRAGVTTGGGKSVYVRGLIKQLAGDQDITLYTGEGELLDQVQRLPIRIKQIPGGEPSDAGLSRFLDHLPGSKSTRASIVRYLNARRSGICRQMSRDLDVLYVLFYLDDLLLSRTVDVPTVYHSHGLSGRGIGERIRKYLSASELCLANTEVVARELSRSYEIETDGIVSPGIDCDLFTPDAEPAFDTDAPSVLFVGRLDPINGVHELLEAHANLDVDAELYVVGHGGLEEELRKQVARRGLDDRVHFLGPVLNPQLPRYYAAADVVCNPSHYESLGMVNLEALACEKPLVTTRLDAITNYVSHGETGILVPPRDVDALADALELILDCPALRQRLADRAREVALEYSWKRQATRLTEIFESELSVTDARPCAPQRSGGFPR